jgi:two-component system, NarL family, response regulator NreC
MKRIKILIVDDYLLVRLGIICLLKDVNNLVIVGESEDGKTAVEKVKRLKPDVVLMNILKQGDSGIQTIIQIKEFNPLINILILTIHENKEYIFSLLKQGASGILYKDVGKDELIKAINKVAEGKKYFGNSISQIMIESLLQKTPDDKINDKRGKIFLTKREKEVLHLIANGLSNQEIAERLEISSRTVDTHKTNLMQKLNIKTTTALAKYAFENSIK